MFRKSTIIILFMLLAVSASGCVVNQLEVGPTEIVQESVERGDVTAVDVVINMGVGDLSVDNGADNLLDAEFTYNVAEWRPIVEYTTTNNRGRLTISQPETNQDNLGVPDNELRYEWDLAFNNDTPLNMKVNLGVGESDLDLNGLILNNLEINTGVGQSTIDLSGTWDQGFNATIQGGIGETIIYLPSDVGVRVEAETGIGSLNVNGLIQNGNVYTNTAYDSSDTIIELRVTGGIGSITLSTR